MKKKLLAFIVCISVSFYIFAMSWPVREGRLEANFGVNDQGIPLLGNFFAASGSVFPSDVGNLIFVHDPENPASRFASPLGAWMAIDHGDNLIGLYARYEERRDAQVPTLVEPGTVLSSTGSSGWSEQHGVYFAIFDRSERHWVNPSVLIIGTVSGVEDTTPPVFRQVELRSRAGTSYNPAQTQRLTQGLYGVYVDIYDTIEPGGSLLAPNRITCFVNGVETGILSFETLLSREGKRMVYQAGTVPASQVYDERSFCLGEIHLPRGQVTLYIEGRDMADNARSVTYRLTIE